MDIKQLLCDVKENKITTEEAEKILKQAPFEELEEYAKLDLHRGIRQGFPEVVYCSGKKDEYLVNIFKTLYEKNGEVMGTRASKEQYELIKAKLPDAKYDEDSRIIKIAKSNKALKGNVVICTAGTADIPVAKEAVETAEFMGARVTALYDVGVCGIHRLLSHLETLQGANCIVAVAGMEGALASVVAGLVSCPVIAVPTSVGYGASLDGLSALLTMINSCANGISVVNIDNGYGAGYMAAQINKQSVKE